MFMGFLEFIFGAKKIKVKEYLKNGGVILDVRTQREWDKGHIDNAIHVPLDELKDKVNELKAMNKSFVVCCESGVRSAKATKYLVVNNIKATNGGGWVSLKASL